MVFKKLQIINSIISSNFIDMVNNFFGGKIATKIFFHYKSMFVNISRFMAIRMLRHENMNISSTSFSSSEASFFSSNKIRTRSGTELCMSNFNFRSIGNKFFSAPKTVFYFISNSRIFHLAGLIIILSLFFVNNSLAGDPIGLISYPPQKIMGFRGLDTRSTKPTIQDSRASDLLNVSLSSAFDVRQRFGFSVINDTLDDLNQDSPAITGIFDSLFSDGTSRTFAFVGDQIQYDNSGTWTEVGNYYDVPDVTAGKNNQWQCIMALDTAVCTNDTDVPISLSSTPSKVALLFTGLTNAVTRARTHIWYRNFLIFGNTFENSVERPTRFRWSNVGTTETWTDTDFVDISTFAGDEIIAFEEIYGELYIFLTDSIWTASLVGGDDVFLFRKVIDGVGAVSSHVTEVVNLTDNRTAVFFLTDKKRIKAFNGASIQDIGNIIQPSLDDLNESRLENAVATFDEKDFIFCASTSGITENDICYLFQTEIAEWTIYSNVNANAMAQVKETDNKIKTYFGDYGSFIYWLNNPDNLNDVDGATGVVDSSSIGHNTDTITGAQVILDTDLTPGSYTGAIIRITSGTGVGGETTIMTNLAADTGIVVTSPFPTAPDSTSVYSIGDINAFYTAKPYDYGDSAREKQFLGMFLIAEEASNNAVNTSFAIDFGSTVSSTNLSLAPSGSSLWDTAVWDVGTWGSTGDKISTVRFTGFGNFIEPKFQNDSIDESFHLYGFNLLGIGLDLKQ